MPERTYTTVMFDLARIQEESGSDRTFIKEGEWGQLIIELAELDEPTYKAALATHLTLTRIADITKPFVARK